MREEFSQMQRRNRCLNGIIKPNKNLSVNSKSYPTPLPLSQPDGLTQPHLGCLSIRRLHMIWTQTLEWP